MELSQIKYFILAAQMQNISKAARVLNITQPTLSKSMSNLERELGTQLFDRSGKKLILNERGKRFLDGAILSIQELDAAAAAAQDQLISSTLILGLYHLSDRFMNCLSAFSREYPDIILQIWQLDISSEEIDTNEFDMLLYPRCSFFRKYKGETLYSEPYYIAVNRANPLAQKAEVGLDDLEEQKLIFLKFDKKTYDIPYYICRNNGIGQGCGIFTNSYEIQRQLVSKNTGVGFVAQDCSGSYKNDPSIALLSIRETDMSQEIMVGFKREKHLSENGKLFSKYVMDYFNTRYIWP